MPEQNTHYVESAHDFEVRFQECWGVKGDKIIYSSSFHNDLSNKVKMKYYVLEEYKKEKVGNQTYQRHWLKDTDVSCLIEFDNDFFPIPRLGFINHSFFTLFFERKHKKSSPSRYRRGFRQDTVDITNPSLYELDLLLGSKNIFRMDRDSLFQNSVNDLFFPYFFQYDEALKSILSGDRLAAAITPTIALKYDASDKSIVIMKNMWKIGDYDEKSTKFKLRTDLFNEDLREIGVNI
jgi:hypothetical protein